MPFSFGGYNSAILFNSG